MTQPTSTGIPSLDAEQPKRRTRVWWFVLVLALLGLCWFAWSQNRAVPTVPVAPASIMVAPAASAPEAAPSAPLPVAAPVEAPAAEVAKKTHTVKPGDELLKLFGKHAQAVCDLNKEALPKGCDHIEVDQELALPEGVSPREVSAERQARAAKPAAARPVAAALPKTNDAGEILYRRVGTAPLNGCGKRDIADISLEAWNVLGLSVDDQAWLQLNADLVNGPRLNASANAGVMRLDTGIRLEQVTFCRKGKVVSMGPMRTAWDADTAVYGERFVLPSGKVLVWMRNCFNWVILPEEKPEQPPPPPPSSEEPPAAPPAPPAPPAEAPPEPPAPPPTIVAAESNPLCRFDPHAVIGQEHEPKHDGGDHADSNFLSAALFCTWYDEKREGTHGLGASLTASNWSGTVNQRLGKYQGSMHLVGPAYEFISDNGWDATVSVPMVGKLHERFSQDQYRSERNFSLVGLSAGANFYQRRLAGKEWFPETQVFGTWAKPLSGTAKHSWNGERIADTAELSRFDNYLNLGVRSWIYETPDSKVLPYAQFGYFLEAPSSESLSARLGISDPHRIAGFGIGFDKDLQNGGHAVAAWGWWLDVVKGVQVTRYKYRKHQIVTEVERRGTTIEEAHDGGLIIRSSESAEPARQ